ncbi:MAG: ABC transporter permease [bacterium]|nr:ABC transporter permease [bacterium]
MSAVRVFGATLKKELKEVFKRKTIIIWVAVIPAVFAFLMCLVFTKPTVSKFKIIIVNKDKGNLGKVLVEIFENLSINGTKIFKIIHMKNLSAALEKLRRSADIDLVLYIPANFTASIRSLHTAELYIYYSLIGGTSAIVLRKGIIAGVINGFAQKLRLRALNITMHYVPKNYAAYIQRFFNFILNPVKLVFKPAKSVNWQAFTKTYGILLSIIFFLLFGVLSGSVRSFYEEIEKKTIRRIANKFSVYFPFVFAKLIALVIIFSITAFEILFIIAGYCHLKIDLPLIIAILAVLVSTMFFASIGGICVALVKKEREASQLAILVAWLVAFLGGLFVPVKYLPPALRLLAKFIPAANVFNAAMNYYIYGASLTSLLFYSFLCITETIIAVIILAIILQRIARS